MTTQPLAGPRVLEVGRGVATAWAARLLAEAGADVIKIESPTGDPQRAVGPFPGGHVDPNLSGVFVALNIGKRSVVIDPTKESDRVTWTRLLEWADILVLDHSPDHARAEGLDAATLRSTYPRLVVLSITPWGVSGPRAHYHATELTIAHASGWASMCPSTHLDATLPPLKVYGSHCGLMTGVAGAMSALAMHFEAQRSGQGDFIDLSEQAYVASVLEVGVPSVGYRGAVPFRYHPRGLLPWRIFEAKDGPIFIVCVEQDQWERLVQFMGNPEWAQLEIFADIPSRAANQDVLHTFLQEFVAEWTVNDLFHAAQKYRVGIAPVMNYAQLSAAEHVRARNFFAKVLQPGMGAVELMQNPVLTSNGRAPIRAPAPSLGQHTRQAADLQPRSAPAQKHARRRPLDGVRVIDLSWAWAGPFCALNLGHLGAEVIRLESSVRPDLYRRLPIYSDEFEPTLNSSGMFNQWNQGKRSVAVALNTAEGKQIVKDFVAKSDVVVQNFATGVLERLGLGYDVLKSINPGIILASVSGYGQTGPWREYLGYGPSAAALTGLCSVTGYVDGGPEELGLSMPDPTSGITAAYGVVAALLKREATGVGDHVDVSLWEATAVLGLEAWMQHTLTGAQPQRMGNRHPTMSPHGCYRCFGDDAWVTIACYHDQAWQKLAALIDPRLLHDERFATLAARKANEDELDALIGAWTAPLDRWTVTRVLQGQGIPAFPSQSCRDVVDYPHLNARGFIERLHHAEVGVRPHTGIPWRYVERPNGVQRPAPCIGADTDDALRNIVGYDDAKIAALRTAGVLQ